MNRHDYFGCTTCHADPSGGALLTAYGRAQADLLLRMRYGSAGGGYSEQNSDADFDSFDDFGDFDEPVGGETAAPAPKTATEPAPGEAPTTAPLWGLLPTPDWLLLGGSYRHLTLYRPTESSVRTFPMQMDLYGQVEFEGVSAAGTLGLSRVPAGSPFARRAQITTNQGNGWNLISRTHWLGLKLGGSFTLRAGRLDLPFGVRIPEHTMWVRRETRTDRESSQQHGLAVAYDGNLVRGELMGIAGNYQMGPDEVRERGYSGYVEVHAADFVYVGASSLLTHARADFQTFERDVTRQVHGVFARAKVIEPLVVLAEGDALVRSRRNLGYVGFLQFDLELVQGLHTAATAEILDRGYQDTGDPFNTIRKVPGFGEPALGGWLTLDWFFLPQLEARLDAVARQEEPFTVLAQLHVLL